MTKLFLGLRALTQNLMLPAGSSRLEGPLFAERSKQEGRRARERERERKGPKEGEKELPQSEKESLLAT